MRTLGEEGLAEASNDAILAANYLLAQVRDSYDVAFDRPCMHEFVLSASRQRKQGASALDVAKALIDEGFHPPTVYFPLVVPEALMIEPTETEPRETLDAFAAAMVRVAERAKTDPASVKAAPLPGPGGRGTVAVLLANIYERETRSSAVIERVPAGTQPPQSWRAAREGEPYRPPEWAEVPLRGRSTAASRVGYLAVADTAVDDEIPHRLPTADDYLKTAEAFIGVPYLWGGTTALGIDCSGFVQQVYRLNGVALPRDADQQAMLGRKVDTARAGDLMFFGGESVTHVALATSAREFIHAPMKGRVVERGELGGDRKLRITRRYLPAEMNA